MKGGSKASNLVMETNPKLCDQDSSVVNLGPKVDANVNDLNLYATTGGGRKKGVLQSLSNSLKPLTGALMKKKRKSRKRKSKAKSNKKSASNRSCSSCTSCGFKRSKRKRNRNKNKKGGGSGHRHNNGEDENLKLRGSCNTGGGKKYKKRGGGAGCCGGKDKKLEGGGSDWKSTVYSRGPVNTTDMNAKQFRMFTQEAEFMPNQKLLNANFLKGGRRRTNKIRSDRR